MADTIQNTTAYLADFERFAATAPGRGHRWLASIRDTAMARFAELGFPTTRDEEWRYTNIAPITGTAFARANGASNGYTDIAIAIEPFTGWDAGGARLVFVNGRFVSSLSERGTLPTGITVGSLADALESGSPMTEAHLAQHAGFEHDALTALNTAFLQDGACIHVAKGTVVETPIHLIFATTSDGQSLVSYPRNLIVADASSQVTVIESHVGLGGEACWTNAVTEIVAGENAVVDHYKIERESESAAGGYHIGTVQLHQYGNSNVTSHTLALGGALVRNNINTLLDAEGCASTMNGLYILGGSQHVDNHLRVEHAQPRCNSREFFKGVLDDHARGVFAGRIVVHKDAQKTDAKQTNQNLLLSEDALIDTKPQLEILADDVKCTHGATIGQVDEDAIFYLRTRGIAETAARSLLVYAFASEGLDDVRVPALRDHLNDLLFARLPYGEQLREAI